MLIVKYKVSIISNLFPLPESGCLTVRIFTEMDVTQSGNERNSDFRNSVVMVDTAADNKRSSNSPLDFSSKVEMPSLSSSSPTCTLNLQPPPNISQKSSDEVDVKPTADAPEVAIEKKQYSGVPEDVSLGDSNPPESTTMKIEEVKVEEQGEEQGEGVSVSLVRSTLPCVNIMENSHGTGVENNGSQELLQKSPEENTDHSASSDDDKDAGDKRISVDSVNSNRGEDVDTKKSFIRSKGTQCFDCVMYIHTCLCTEDNSS